MVHHLLVRYVREEAGAEADELRVAREDERQIVLRGNRGVAVRGLVRRLHLRDLAAVASLGILFLSVFNDVHPYKRVFLMMCTI